MYQIVYTSHAQKDAKKLKTAGLKEKAESLLSILGHNPYQNPPPYEKLVGDLKDCFLRRINIQHRLVYKIYEKEKIVKILKMWSHYE